MHKLRILLLFSIILAYALTMAACSGEPSIKLSKDWIPPQKTIDVKWKASAKLQKKDAWIGVVPADTPDDAEITHDNDDLYYQLLKGKSSGKFEMKVPARKIKFEMRIYDAEEDGKVLASAPFTVSNALE